MFTKMLLVFFAFAVITQPTFASVWQTTRNWDAHVETDFAAWIRSNWKEDVFISPQSSYQGIATDCAQATYAMRVIFLYEHGLPLKFRNHSTGSGYISNDMTNWDKIADPNLRLRELLKYTFSNISTRTLGLDTYPVAVSPEGINSGAIYVDPGNHSVQIIDLTPQGVPIIQFSTVPQSVRFLTRMIAFPEMIPGQAQTSRDDGFRRFKSPDQVAMSLEKIQGYSDEQWALAADALGDWTEYTNIFTKHLAQVNVSVSSRAHQMIDNICQAGDDRVKAVRDGLIVLAVNSDKNIQCMDSGDYYNTSTPDRDKVLREYFIQLQKLTQQPEWQQASNDAFYHDYADYIIGKRPRETRFVENCDLSQKGIGAPTASYDLRDLFEASIQNKLVSDPNASLEKRWGLTSFTPVCKEF